MAVWLYQMSAENYTPEEYREAIWEGQVIRWPSGKVSSNFQISPGDIVILVFVKTGTHEPGIYGWGIIINYKKEKETIAFRPTYPSDYLKMNPIGDDEVSDMLDKIRRPIKQGTMWEVGNVHVTKFRQKIQNWIR
jgi:hypothetical protein